jgi:hypothetical protein
MNGTLATSGSLASRSRKRVIAARQRLGPEEVFLVAEPDVMSYAELQERIGLMLHGEEWPTLRIPAPLAKAGAWLQERLGFGGDGFIKPWMVDLADENYPVYIARAERVLGWRPLRRLRNSLDRILSRLV